MKVLLIGFDGADWRLVSSLMKKKLSNFNKLAKIGTAAPLESVIPPISPPAWASIVTGVNPGKHGVYEFVEFNRKSFSKNIRPNPIRIKKIWNYLDEAGYRSIIINFPLMYPPEKINGITISGLMTPSSAKYFTYPKSLTEKLRNMGYEIEIHEVELFRLLHSNKEKLYNRLIQTMKKRAKISIELLTQENWDFSMVVFGETDRIQHFFWNRPKKIRQCYIEMDKILGSFMSKIMDDDTVLMVVSDHGFRGISKYFYINSWLYSKGLLSFKDGIKKVNIREKILRFLNKLRIGRLLNYIPKDFGRIIPDSKIRASDIDPTRTKVYCISGYGYLVLNNLNSRDKTKIKRELLGITDPENGKKVIKSVLEKEEAFFGEYIDRAPDLILIPDDDYFFQDKYLSNKLFDKVENAPGLAKRFGEHSRIGVLFTSIKNILSSETIRIYDIVPTVLSVFKISFPEYIDGTSLLG